MAARGKRAGSKGPLNLRSRLRRAKSQNELHFAPTIVQYKVVVAYGEFFLDLARTSFESKSDPSYRLLNRYFEIPDSPYPHGKIVTQVR